MRRKEIWKQIYSSKPNIIFIIFYKREKLDSDFGYHCNSLGPLWQKVYQTMCKAKVQFTHIVGPTMCADKSWAIWHPISTLCKRVWLTWSHKICILVSVKHFSPTNVCVMTFTETDRSQTSKLSCSWTSTQEAVNIAAPCWKLLWGWYVSGFKLVENQESAKISV